MYLIVFFIFKVEWFVLFISPFTVTAHSFSKGFEALSSNLPSDFFEKNGLRTRKITVSSIFLKNHREFFWKINKIIIFGLNIKSSATLSNHILYYLYISNHQWMFFFIKIVIFNYIFWASKSYPNFIQSW